MIYSFQRPPTVGRPVGTFIFVSRLRGSLSRERIDPQQLAARHPQATITTEPWKDFEIEVFRVPERFNGVDVLTLNAQVPIKPEAIQVTVFGESADENELQNILRLVLSHLDGETNWLSTEERIARLISGGGRMAIFLVGAIFVALFIIRSICGR